VSIYNTYTLVKFILKNYSKFVKSLLYNFLHLSSIHLQLCQNNLIILLSLLTASVSLRMTDRVSCRYETTAKFKYYVYFHSPCIPMLKRDERTPVQWPTSAQSVNSSQISGKRAAFVRYRGCRKWRHVACGSSTRPVWSNTGVRDGCPVMRVYRGLKVTWQSADNFKSMPVILNFSCISFGDYREAACITNFFAWKRWATVSLTLQPAMISVRISCSTCTIHRSLLDFNTR
jgi:hypothetical protein